MRAAVFALVFALVPSAVHAAGNPVVPPEVASAPGAAAYPDDEGLFVRQEATITLRPDGAVTRHHEAALKVFTQWPIAHGYFDPTLSWNDRRATLTVDQARTYTVDGRIVEARANSIVPNTAGALEQAAPYAHLRSLTVAQVGVEEGGTTVLAFTVADRNPTGIPLWGVQELNGELPVADQLITIAVPEKTPLHWSALGCTVKPDIRTADGATRYVFHQKNLPAVNAAEANPRRLALCRLAYSTAADWGQVRAFLQQRIGPAVAPTDALKNKARALAGGATLDEERVAKIHAFVVDGVQTVSWPFEAFDYTARSAADVLNSSVGHGLDKAVLLAALLRALDYDAAVVLVAGARGVPMDTPSPVLFDEAWVRVRAAGRTVWLDPLASTDKRAAPHLAGRATLVVDGTAGVPDVVPDLTSGTNHAAMRAKVKLDDAGHELRVSGGLDVDLAGLYVPVRSFDRGKEKLAGTASALAAKFGGAKASDLVVAEKSADVAAFHANLTGGVLPVARDGRPVALTVPRVPGALAADALQLYRGRRTLPLLLPAPAEERTEVVFELPGETTVLFAPSPVRVDNPVGTLVREVERDGRTLTVRSTLTLKRAEVAPSDYDGLRALFAELEPESAHTVLVRTGH